MGNHRYRLDREGLDDVAAIWWAAEHPNGPPFPEAPDETRTIVAAHVKGLLKRRRAETLGDVAALAAVDEATAASTERAALKRERLAWLESLPTPLLIRLLRAARPDVYAVYWDPWLGDGRPETPNRTFTRDEIKAVLATREHIPNRAEREVTRRARAKSARAQRQRQPPPRRR